ncbi:hypothetical protein M2451_004058 [Dysgonomonas sp. PFB1-18]|uniref:hypothetical protein n=1 Tax=unclassified Dysgonomonas TaxID=2630389 RepID=UPI002476901A|nr:MULTISPECIES: hypothetical protein [unclassified Dysgonomonas]MDH6310903.1 hypothetical protein [Dysgonomonas sp. PF1-14]MDH6341028.1 hypothetical protein [Dysgonomonas sp. PF1-16]MDH6382711.1 hypothetical protein [Dysgonomonas sp. PFB1-18]MDH6400026.1 hypothetical protein [Dysgonomonas sp. PF1-23]
MKNIKENKYWTMAVPVVKVMLLAFIIYTIIQFFSTISQSTLYIIIGIVLSWRVWRALFRLTWLLIQIAIAFAVIYLLIF